MNHQKIRCGILGAGGPNIATNHHLPATMLAPSLELAALADISGGVRDYAEQYRCKAYFSLEEMLEDETIDMIQIATPDQFHCKQALKALEAGRYVLLQKPPCLSFEELSELYTAAGKYPNRLKVILNNRETSLVRTIRKAIADGLIGELRLLLFQYRGRRFPIANPKNFYLKKESGGVWLHNGLHWLDEFSLMTGRLPRSVQCFSTRNDFGDPEFLGEGDNYWSALFDFTGIDVCFEYNTMLLNRDFPGGIRRSYVGTAGEIRVDFSSQDIFLIREGVSVKLEKLPCVYCSENDAVDSFAIALEHFAGQIRSGRPEAPCIEDSLMLTGMLLKALESARLEKVL